MRHMRSLRGTKQLVLFGLSLASRVFDERAGNGFVPYAFLYQRLPLRQASIRNAISQMVRSGEVSKLMASRGNFSHQALVSLSTLGREQLRRFLPALFPVGKSQFGFLLAVFTSPEKHVPAKKKRLRQARLGLRNLGFIKLKKGVYCACKGLSSESEKLIIRLGLTQEILLIPFEGASFFKANELSSKVLKLQDSVVVSLKLIKEIQKLLTLFLVKKRLKDEDNHRVGVLIKDTFVALKRTPALPRALAPTSWPVEELKKQLKSLSDAMKK